MMRRKKGAHTNQGFPGPNGIESGKPFSSNLDSLNWPGESDDFVHRILSRRDPI